MDFFIYYHVASKSVSEAEGDVIYMLYLSVTMWMGLLYHHQFDIFHGIPMMFFVRTEAFCQIQPLSLGR